MSTPSAASAMKWKVALPVILAGILVLVLGSPYPDYVIGTLIGLYVVKEALEILSDARTARSESKTSR